MSEKNKETSFSVSVRKTAAMKPTDDDLIKAIVLTVYDVEQLTVDTTRPRLDEPPQMFNLPTEITLNILS